MARPSKIDLEVAWHMREVDKHTLPEIAAEFGVTKEAVRQALNRYAETQEQLATTGRVRPAEGWPWVIAMDHAKENGQYRVMLALKQQRAGLPVERRYAATAQRVYAFITERNLAITYHRKVGFVHTNRLPEDGDEIFVARSDEWWEQMLGQAA